MLTHTLCLQNYLTSDRKTNGPRTQSIRTMDPGLDLERIDAVIDAIFALQSQGYGRNCYPIELKITDANRAETETLGAELETLLQRFKAAGARVTSAEPSRRDAYVLCTMDTYVETIDPNPSDPLRYTSMSIQDMGYQVDGFAQMVPDIAKAENLVSIVAFGNDMRTLGFNASRLTKLRALDLSQNLLNSIPEELLDCGSLEYLSLHENPVQHVPATIGKLRSLRYLGVSGTRLTNAQIDSLKVALPQCVIDHTRRVYSHEEKLMNFVLNSQTWIVRADGVVEVPGGALPRGTGRHLLPATADLPTASGIALVASMDAATGDVRLFHRDGGDWKDVTSIATASTLMYGLAQ